MDIAHYFDNPEELNKETLYELRNLINQLAYCF